MNFKFGRKCVLEPQNFRSGTRILGFIICNGGSHMFHSDPRMRSMPNYIRMASFD